MFFCLYAPNRERQLAANGGIRFMVNVRLPYSIESYGYFHYF